MSDGAGVSGTESGERQQLEGEFVLAMRKTSLVSQLLSQASAERIGINVTDLNCLNVIALTGSMTAGELARATGLTTASITGVLDRLEDSGFVRRERDPGDRRRVNIVLNAGRALRDVAPVFAPMLKAWRAVAARYSDDELRQFVGFQQELEQIMRDQLTRLRFDGKLALRGRKPVAKRPVYFRRAANFRLISAGQVLGAAGGEAGAWGGRVWGGSAGVQGGCGRWGGGMSVTWLRARRLLG